MPDFLERAKKPLSPIERQRRALDRVLARMDAKRKAKAAKAVAKSKTTNKRRRQERFEAREPVPNIFKRANPRLLRKLALPVDQVICARMADDAWYSFGDLRRLLPEYAAGTLKTQAHLLRKRGLVEKAGNPEFELRPADLPSRTIGRYLYKLTATGSSAAVEWRRALSTGSDKGGA